MDNLDIILEKLEQLEKKIDEKDIKPERKLISRSESIVELSKAFAMFQAEVNNPINTTTNSFFKNKYATLGDVLNEVRPILAKYGLSILQMPAGDGGIVQLTTLIMHTSGEWIETEPMTMRPEKGTPQGVGSALTYARRYSLSTILGVASEDDDDGNDASQPQKSANKSKKTKKKKPTDDALEKLILEIMEKAKTLQASGIAQNDIMDVFKNAEYPNPKNIPDVKIAKNIMDELNKLG